MIVVDTHIIVWDAIAPDRLSAAAEKALTQADRDGEIVISEISLWEIAMLMKKKRLTVATEYKAFIDLILQSRNYTLQNLAPEIADASVHLDMGKNKDPADHIIAATAQVSDFPLITADQQIHACPAIKTIW